MFITAAITSNFGYYAVWPCAKIHYSLSDAEKPSFLKQYPGCAAFADGSDLKAVAPVAANIKAGSINAGAALDISFGMALWLSFVVHVFFVELYLHLTQKEALRLRQYSYQRQLEACMNKPGSAGIVTDRFGDADPFKPQLYSVDSGREHEAVVMHRVE